MQTVPDAFATSTAATLQDLLVLLIINLVRFPHHPDHLLTPRGG
jgi:hypothetical protein